MHLAAPPLRGLTWSSHHINPNQNCAPTSFPAASRTRNQSPSRRRSWSWRLWACIYKSINAIYRINIKKTLHKFSSAQHSTRRRSEADEDEDEEEEEEDDKGSAKALQLLHKVKLNCSIILSTFDYVFWPRQASLGFQLRLLPAGVRKGQKGKGAGELGNWETGKLRSPANCSHDCCRRMGPTNSKPIKTSKQQRV